MKFPRLMFRTPGPEQCQGGTYAHKSVDGQEAFEAALQAGWHATLPDALAPPVPAPQLTVSEPVGQLAPALAPDVPPAPPAELTEQEQAAPATYDEMKTKATQLGLEYPGNISKAALLAMITAKLAEQA